MHHNSGDIQESRDKPRNAPISPDDAEETEQGDALQNTREIRYFLNEGTYGEKEKAVLAALKNEKHRRIISEILNCDRITHETLAGKIGVSAPTINWHIRHLKEEGIVRADTNGRHTEYSINRGYRELLHNLRTDLDIHLS
jgi:predicted transcriptional regulator